jgi:hypothetical protein
LPADYGFGACAAHDDGLAETGCEENGEDFCLDSWCYVTDECAAMLDDASPSTIPGNPLSYSYANCGSDDIFTADDDSTDVVDDSADVVDDSADVVDDVVDDVVVDDTADVADDAADVADDTADVADDAAVDDVVVDDSADVVDDTADMMPGADDGEEAAKSVTRTYVFADGSSKIMTTVGEEVTIEYFDVNGEPTEVPQPVAADVAVDAMDGAIVPICACEPLNGQ